MFNKILYISFLGGSGKENLYTGKSKELRMAQELRSALSENFPHARDYPDPEKLRKDHNEYLSRINAIDNLINTLSIELEDIAEHRR